MKEISSFTLEETAAVCKAIGIETDRKEMNAF